MQHRHPKWASLSAALTVATAVHAQVTFYVDDDAPAGGDGLSWYSAFDDLQDALDASRLIRADINIQIAQGVYTPDRGTGQRGLSFDVGDEQSVGPASAFVLQIQGGFAGLGSPQPDANDPRTFVTVLSGDLEGNDTDAPESRADNAYHVLTLQAGATRPVRIISLTVRGGQADGEFPGQQVGAGAYLDANSAFMALSATFSNCIITDCHATREGGGIYADLYWLILTNTIIQGCTAETGGGVATDGVDRVYMDGDCTIADCSAQTGGAFSLGVADTLYASRSIFAGNSAVTGGAIAARGPVSIDGCLFAQNSASAGGAIHSSRRWDTLDLRSTSMIDNRADVGSAVWTGADAEILGCVLSSTQSGDAGLIWIEGHSELQLWESCVEGGTDAIDGFTSYLRWGVGMIETDPLLVDRAGTDDDPSTWRDNDYRPSSASPCIDAAPALGPLTVEGLNEPRPFNSTCSCMTIADMGCYEYIGWSCPTPSPRLYVDASAPAGGDGLSWATAFDQIQDALRMPGVQEIWVASGMYFPPRPEYGYALELSCINPGARLLGGFAGWETEESQRDPAANVTIISADQSLNDDSEFPPVFHSNFMVMYVAGGQAQIDGFTIDTGRIFIDSGDVTFSACAFTEIDEAYLIKQIAGALRLQDCLIHNNSSNISTQGSLLIDGCTIRHNAASWYYELVEATGLVEIDRTQFLANRGYDRLIGGGALQTITNSTFVGNAPQDDLIRARGFSEIFNCAFAANEVEAIATAYFWDPPMLFSNCWVWESGADLEEHGNWIADFCLADFPLAGAGNQFATDPEVTRLPSPGRDNHWGTPDDDFGDLSPRAFSALIDAGDSYALPDAASVSDLAGELRLVDDLSIADTGLGFPTVDIGPYERQINSCLPDWDDDGSLTFNDALTYLGDYDAQDPRADLNSDGQFGFYDVQIFLNAFAAGCP